MCRDGMNGYYQCWYRNHGRGERKVEGEELQDGSVRGV